MFKKRKIGIALSGGAARGLSHIGVLQVLEEIGVEINAVAGCSMGAIVGALYSTGRDLKEIENYIASTDWKNFLMFSMISLSRSGLVNDKKVDDILKKFLGDLTFTDCKKQFCCVAADHAERTRFPSKRRGIRQFAATPPVHALSAIKPPPAPAQCPQTLQS